MQSENKEELKGVNEEFLTDLFKLIKNQSVHSTKKAKLIKSLLYYKPNRVRNGMGLREHKTPYQTIVLEKAYQENSHWDRKKNQELAKLLGLKPAQVYKWNWDRNELKGRKRRDSDLPTEEEPPKLFKIIKDE